MVALLLAVYGSSFLVVALHVRAYQPLSPIDELQHFDYMVKASRGQFVRDYERVGQTAMRAEACRGVDAPGFQVPPCDSERFEPSHFQELGYNTASSQSPVYYALTGLVARAIVATHVTRDLLAAGRLAGSLWLGTGVLILIALLIELRVPRTNRAVVVGLLVSAPVVLHASATVNPDGALLAGGGLILLAVLRWERKVLRWWWLAVVGLVAFVVEPTTAIAVVLVVVYLAVRSVQPSIPDEVPARPFVHALGAVGALLGPMVLAFVVSLVVRKAMALDVGPVVLPRDAQFASPTLTFEQVANQVGALVTPFDNPYRPAFLRTVLTTLFMTLTSWLVLGASIGSALLRRAGTRIGALGVAASTAMIIGGPLFVLSRIGSGTFFPIPARYGLPIVPALLVLVATALRKRASVVAGGVYSTVVAVYTVSLLIRA